MKRHPALIPLSHDHHEGLVLAQCLIRGYAKSHAMQWAATPEGQCAEVASFFEKALRPHFEAEERIVFPVARERLDSEGLELVERLIGEHGQLEDLADRLAKGAADRSLLREFGRLLEGHIRLEERSLFEALQSALSDEELRAMGERLKAFESRQAPDGRRCSN